ncbi:uncharacterized protein KQ657_002899 [Scheffersomyces spartinae]|uniref:Transcription initiation factor IIE subunit beta n=1 Tax=Scheffersomyces spartinae TaxID=45513 RepID=A0A9P7V5I7_9ASCO|nr:uncharacterized protein KQ657_002899 [Scheffersomyces spartinae]KAG7191630.1 hypothetical protein KQ657_002899 [Scheffersomyces spartinae]
MSDLSAQLSAFKSKIRSGPSVSVARRAVQPKRDSSTVSSPENGVSSPSKRKTGLSSLKSENSLTESIVKLMKRQKLALNSDGSDMTSSHLSTLLHLAVEYIKEHDTPISVGMLQNYLLFDGSGKFLELLSNVNRVKYDEVNKTLEYVSLHNIRSADDLLNFLRSQQTFKGTSVKELKDGWAGCLNAINQLESDGKILVLRNKKENAPRLVWANQGGPLGGIDDEFKEMWIGVKLPEPDDLYQALIDHSLKPTGADPALIKKKPQQQEKKQKKARRGKITNTHMKGILKDYSQLV